jgi:hypothetical protein
MKLSIAMLSAGALLALTACSTAPVSAPAASATAPAQPAFQAEVTQFLHPQVNEAASAYVSHYKQTVEESLQAGKYQSELASRYLNAESCFESRASRLLDKSLTAEEKAGLLKAHVPAEKRKAYETLARGHVVRANGLETFSCEIAGLAIDRNNVRY